MSAVEIPAALVKQLRDTTGAGMMECKRALQETGGDIDAAVTLLRERGMAQAAKRAGRATTEGLVGYRIRDGVGTIVAIGCETEPVSKNDEFQEFGKRVLEAVERDGVEAIGGLESERAALSAKLGENIVLQGARFAAGEGETLAAYVHPPANKKGVLVKLRGGDEQLGRFLAMHISFADPRWKTRGEVPAEAVESERQIYLNSDELQGKPEQAREKIVEGMLGKRFFAATPGGVLADQAWIHDASKSVGRALEEAGAELVEFAYFSVAG